MGRQCKKYKHNMAGPKTLEEWIEAYEERDSDTDYVLSPGERVVYDPMHGFFTYYFDAANKEILIPKMCGDGKHWRKLIYRMALVSRKHLGVKGVLCCTKRNPMAYMRILGGQLVKMEHTYDFRTGKETTLWFIFITPEDTKERDDGDDCCAFGAASADTDMADGSAREGWGLDDSRRGGAKER